MSEEKLNELFKCKEDLRNDESLTKIEWFYEWYTLQYKILEARGLSNEKAIEDLKTDSQETSHKIGAFIKEIERHWDNMGTIKDGLNHINVCLEDIDDCQKEKIAIDRVIRENNRNHFLGES
ncbi:hypothetical protein UFOVP270_55 [uncultured Caudovirales phage]|uniref:Uncharacterized protein n=1 Tax=uncultured Caudovirales phage TaxID=2100421 RepID=A0A6J5L3P0_9CAUD|nr:hypothetical protein UFOVP101_2 [uncultured Caudovirales phage]CAB4134409.1 hypothetical protein UFOVP270_55 [uncultured Caudovirales phage]